jgi:hypothetical protein
MSFEFLKLLIFFLSLQSYPTLPTYPHNTNFFFQISDITVYRIIQSHLRGEILQDSKTGANPLIL